MEKDKNIVYMSYDADSAGRKIGKAVLNDDPEEMHKISERISAGNKLFNRWAMDRGGICYSSGGDQGVYSIPTKYLEELKQLRADYHYVTDLTVSIGIGEHLSESGQALLMAKLKGKDQVVFFDKKTKKEIAEIKKRAKKGRFKSMEEYKIAEAYLNKSEQEDASCPYCEQTDNVDPSHCKFCHDSEPQESGESCPFCQNDPSMGAQEPEISDEDCTFCKEKDQSEKDSCQFCKQSPEALVSPDSNNSNSESGSQQEQEQAERMGMNPPEIGKPALNDHAPIGQNAPMDTVPKDGAQDPNQRLDDQRDVPKEAPAIDPEDNHSKVALTSIANQIKDEETPVDSQIDAVGEEDMSSGSDMEGNVSRPEGFIGQNTPSDMGEEGPNAMSESDSQPGGDEPDLGSILEEGLDQHASSIQKEKAIQMVSQALTEFKGCKNILEQYRDQMPQLYQASISMLRAMIEMAGVLNLGGDTAPGQEDSALGQEQASLEPEQSESDWHNPFPAHPDQGGEEKPGHAPSNPTAPKSTQSKGRGEEKGSVGQPIGKLPSKHTTEHVARTPMPVGAVNAKGQKKVMDDQGKVRFINMKQGMVQGASGVPVKPAKR